MRRSDNLRKGQQGEDTRVALIEAAELLFAQHGTEGVSLRQIGAAAGSSNTNVVGYHFGNKESLVEAIYHYRLPAIDTRRAELLSAADRAGEGQDCRALLKAMWRPLFEQKSARNLHTYARFIASIGRAGLGYTRQALDPYYPATNEIATRLGALTQTDSPLHLDLRLRMQAFMIFGALEYIDLNYRDDENAALSIFEETADMAARAIAP
jgi:AcrR family transcriptional regulator